jgi:DNA repair exonuclease SbcCD ATPase subunit
VIASNQTALDAAKAELETLEAFIAALPAVDKTKEALDQLTREREREDEKQKKLTVLQAKYDRITDKQSSLSAFQEELSELLETIKTLPPFEEARQQFERLTGDIEKANEKLDVLMGLQTDWSVIAEKRKLLETDQAELVRLSGNYTLIKSKYDKLYEQFILGQAGIIAGTLRNGEPCPVCGSSDHPVPAKAPDGDISDEKLKKLQIDSDQVKGKADRKSSDCAALILEIDIFTSHFNTAVATHIPNGNYENSGNLLGTEISEAKVRCQKLSEKKAADQVSLSSLAAQTEAAAARQAELTPLCTALNSEVSTLKEKFGQDLAVFLPDTSWETPEQNCPACLKIPKPMSRKWRQKYPLTQQHLPG